MAVPGKASFNKREPGNLPATLGSGFRMQFQRLKRSTISTQKYRNKGLVNRTFNQTSVTDRFPGAHLVSKAITQLGDKLPIKSTQCGQLFPQKSG